MRLEAVVSGRVQGVGFRVFVLRTARSLGLTGWVANESGGRVRCVAEGARDRLQLLLEALENGPAGAFVAHVEPHWSDGTGTFEGFEVRSGWHTGD